MEIYLVRHGIAQEPADAPSDAERSLTKEGQEKTSRVAKAFARQVSRVDVILHSPYARARETAELFARELPKAKVRAASGLTPHDGARSALPLLQEYDEKSVMIVGHEPHLSSFASLLLTGRELPVLEFKKAGVAGIECLAGLQHCRLSFLLSPKWL
jgi:phosphohistidine phosphatase